MLTFLRKYQKIFFVIVAVVIVISFSFFGTQGVVQSIDKKVKDKVIGKTMTGENIKLSEVDKMSYFLSTDNSEYSSQGRMAPNLFNDGVIKKDFIETGIAKVLVEHYYPILQKDLEERFNKVKNYNSFVHVSLLEISAKNVWEKFCPQINQKLEDIKKMETVSLPFMLSLMDLYMSEKKFPESFLRKILIYQERQYKNVAPDQRLFESMALFGFNNAQDWFGKNFLDVFSEYIINVANFAESKGYKITNEEVAIDLFKHLNEGLKKQQIASGDTATLFKRQLQVLGLDEISVVEIWKKVMLFRKYFNDVASSVVVDKKGTQDFYKFASLNAQIKLYELPEHLRLKKFHDVMLLQTYLEATTNEKILSSSINCKNIEEVLDTYPELVEQKYTLGVKEVDIETASLNISLKKMWDWQVEEENYKLLKQKFSKLISANTKDERFKAFEKLNSMDRNEIDKYSRIQMAYANPSIIDTALVQNLTKELTLSFRKKNSQVHLDLKDKQKFAELVQNSDSILRKYTEDNDRFFSVQVLKNEDNKSIISFNEAKADGTLQKILDQRLKAKQAELNIAEFNENELGLALFPKLKDFNSNKEVDSIVQNYLLAFVKNLNAQMQKDALFLQTLPSEWQLVVKDIEVPRSSKNLFNEAFKMQKDSFSDVKVENGEISFFYLKEFSEKESSLEKMQEVKNSLDKETKLMLGKRMLQMIKLENSIFYPIMVKAN
ncbi:MAG: hypothetical protein HZB76_03935 [Chlamydiae bacterium]|nr:hypothetical protein [Chlamydiota bacterium]